MKRLLIPVLAAGIGLLVGFKLTLGVLPGVIMDKAIALLGERGARSNFVFHSEPVSEASRSVVRPSPDILYSVCAYDLIDQSLLIEFPALDGPAYASVSFFDSETNNFATLNNIEVGGAAKRIRLSTSESTQDGDLQVVTPSETGLVLYRRVLSGGVRLEDAEAHRQGFSCHPDI